MYVVFEGVDGAGKTTLIDFIKYQQRVQDSQFKFRGELGVDNTIWVKEPSFLARKLATRIANNDLALTELFALDREKIHEMIYEYREKDKAIFSDRSWVSSCVYQHSCLDYVIKLNEHYTVPDLMFYLRLLPEEAAKRSGLPLQTVRKLCSLYDKAAEALPRVVVLDATQPVEQLAATVVGLCSNEFTFSSRLIYLHDIKWDLESSLQRVI